MKIIYLSLLSVAILGQASYFYYDYRAKAKQGIEEASFRQQTAAELTDLKTRTDDTIKNLSVLFDTEITAIEARSKRQFQEQSAQLEAQAQKQYSARVADLQSLCDQAKADMAETRAQTETQTNQVISVVNKLRLDSLGKLHDTEAELALLKKQQTSGVSDQELIKREKQKNAALFNPERN